MPDFEITTKLVDLALFWGTFSLRCPHFTLFSILTDKQVGYKRWYLLFSFEKSKNNKAIRPVWVVCQTSLFSSLSTCLKLSPNNYRLSWSTPPPFQSFQLAGALLGERVAATVSEIMLRFGAGISDISKNCCAVLTTLFPSEVDSENALAKTFFPSLELSNGSSAKKHSITLLLGASEYFLDSTTKSYRFGANLSLLDPLELEVPKNTPALLCAHFHTGSLSDRRETMWYGETNSSDFQVAENSLQSCVLFWWCARDITRQFWPLSKYWVRARNCLKYTAFGVIRGPFVCRAPKGSSSLDFTNFFLLISMLVFLIHSFWVQLPLPRSREQLI